MNQRLWIPLICLCCGLVLLVSCVMHDPVIGETDEVAIYSAVIRQLYGPDDTFGGTLQPPIVYLVSRTDDGVGDPEGDRTDPRVLTESLQDAIVLALDNLPAEFFWVERRQDVPLDSSTGQVIDDGVVITLGNIHLQGDGSVHVSGSIYIANLAAGGQTYVLEQVSGEWKVIGNTGVLWIS